MTDGSGAGHVLAVGVHQHVTDREPLAELVQRGVRDHVGGRGLAQEVDVEVRRDATAASRPIIASSATHSPVSASAINDGPLIVPPGRSCHGWNGMRIRACIGCTSSIVKFSIAPGNTSSRNAAISSASVQLLFDQAVDPAVPSAACAAASRAIGTRNGEHDT